MVPLYRSRAWWGAAAFIVLGTSCGGGGADGPTGPTPGGPQATTVQATTSTNQQTRVNRPVDDPPGVIVRDQNGNPMSGVTVSFAVTAGGGAIQPSSVATGGDGIARASTWTLGPTPGANSVTAAVSGLTPVTFNATATQTPASMQAVTPTSQEAPAGTAVADPPGVIVRDIDNTPMAGVNVTFAVTSGNGSIVPSTVATGADGIARLTSWTLGPELGGNTVSATSSGLGFITFSANAIGPPLVPSSVVAISATSQGALIGQQVSEPPAVLVRNQNNDPMPGVSVNFAVTAGGGVVSPSTVVTAADGVAQLTSWVVGPNPGQNTVTATVTGLPSVTFNATGTGCPAPATIVLGTTVNGTLGSSGCTIGDGEFAELYQFTIAEPRTLRITQTSAAFDTYVLLLRSNGEPVAENDDTEAGGTTNSELFVFLTPGTYILVASSFDVGETGPFSIRVEDTASNVTNCTTFFIVQGVTTSQSLSATDCLAGSFRTDFYLIYLKANEQVRIAMNSSQVDAYLALYRDPFISPALVAENDDKQAGTTDAEIVFTPTLAGYYLLEVSSAIGGQTGAYTLVVD
jgi:hypothetical protein